MEILAVTNGRMGIQELVNVLLRVEPSIDAFILRETSKTDAEIVEVIRQLKEAGCDEEKIIVHNRPDLAMLTEIRRVQIPGDGLPLDHLKQQFTSLLFGRSVHSFKEAERAYTSGADWLLYGHLFPSSSKQGLAPRGTDELFRMVQTIPIPIYAIGGILPEHVSILERMNVAGVAIMSAIFSSSTPEEAIVSYKEKLLQEKEEPQWKR